MISRLKSILRRTSGRDPRLDTDLQEEVGSYFAEIESRYVTKGHSSDEARRLTRLELGNPEVIKQRVRDLHFGNWLGLLARDLRYSARSLRKSPVFLIVTTCSLAIGIGANTAMFSFADWWILRPLPVSEPQRVAVIRSQQMGSGGGLATVSYPDYLTIRDLNHSFDGVAAQAYSPFGVELNREGQPQRRMGAYVSGNFFSVLGIQPVMGRAFTSHEDDPAEPARVLVLSHEFWTAAFQGTDVIGRTINLDGVVFTIVGVAPASFTGTDAFSRPAFYLPASNAELTHPEGVLRDRSYRWVLIRARLKPGVSMARAQQDVDGIVGVLHRTWPRVESGLRLKVDSELQFQMQFSPPTTAFLVMLQLMALCVLAVACANVAGLVLSHSLSRSRQLAMKLAIGATRKALFRQSLIESFLIAAMGGGAGVVVALGGMRLLRSLPPPSPDMSFLFHLHLDHRALLFTATVSIVSTFLVGIVPATRVMRLDLLSAIRPVEDGDPGWSRLRLRSVLVAGQVAISVALLIASAVLIGGFRSELEKGPGFRTDDVLATGLDPGLLRYSPAKMRTFYQDILDRSRTMPGVDKAALVSNVPLAFGAAQKAVLPEGNSLRAGEAFPQVISSTVSEGYLDVAGIPLLYGRDFSPSDTATSPLVAIVNEQFAKHFWPGQSAIGKMLRLNDEHGPQVRVIGVSATTKYVFIAEPPLDAIYLPWRQQFEPQMFLLSVGAAGSFEQQASIVRNAVHAIDPEMPVFDQQTMRGIYVDRAIRTPTVITRATSAFGLLGLILALAGLYGIVNSVVGQRTREIGIRMALGAEPRKIVSMIVLNALRLTTAGAVIGTLLGMLSSKGIRTGLFIDVERPGVMPFISVLGAILIAAVIAAAGPARRAARIDPAVTLRDE